VLSPLPGDSHDGSCTAELLRCCLDLQQQLDSIQKQQQKQQEPRGQQPLLQRPQQQPQQLEALVSGWQGLLPGLKTLGQELCSLLPTELACNNPACVTFSGLSEMQGVSGKGRACGGCKVARYCCRECQQQHWKAGHKAVCKRLAASGSA